MDKSRIVFGSTFLFILLLLTGCGGGGGGDPAVDQPGDSTTGGSPTPGDSGPNDSGNLVGVFVDAPVANLQYQTETQEGRTNEQGEFQYREGETVSFSIGSIELPAVEARGVITPLTVFGAANEEDPRVTNLARLLQSLDEDQAIEDEIRIPEGAYSNAAGLNIDFGSEDFDNAVANLIANSGGGQELLSAEAALEHLRAQLEEISQCSTNRYKMTGTDYVYFTFPRADGFDELINTGGIENPLAGELVINQDSCTFIENIEDYSGNCVLEGDQFTVSYPSGFQASGTVAGNTATWATRVTANDVNDGIEYVMALMTGIARDYCAGTPVPAGQYSLQGEENGVSPNPDPEVDGVDFDTYSLSGTLTITETGECSAVTSEGNWPASECRLQGNQLTVFGGVFQGTIGPDTATILYRSPATSPSGESFAGYLRGSRN